MLVLILHLLFLCWVLFLSDFAWNQFYLIFSAVEYFSADFQFVNHECVCVDVNLSPDSIQILVSICILCLIIKLRCHCCLCSCCGRTSYTLITHKLIGKLSLGFIHAHFVRWTVDRVNLNTTTKYLSISNESNDVTHFVVHFVVAMRLKQKVKMFVVTESTFKYLG